MLAERCLKAAQAPVKKSLPDQNSTGRVSSAAPSQARRRVSMLQSRTNGMNWG